MTQAEYLETEFRRYYPEATKVDVINYSGEWIKVHLECPDEMPSVYEMLIGSDDDWYLFEEIHYHNILTIPFQPETSDV